MHLFFIKGQKMDDFFHKCRSQVSNCDEKGAEIVIGCRLKSWLQPEQSRLGSVLKVFLSALLDKPESS